ncbi:hypothetical protein BDW62DRAFT_206666 [Aspergillus aurantiobrunneus]
MGLSYNIEAIKRQEALEEQARRLENALYKAETELSELKNAPIPTYESCRVSAEGFSQGPDGNMYWTYGEILKVMTFPRFTWVVPNPEDYEGDWRLVTAADLDNFANGLYDPGAVLHARGLGIWIAPDGVVRWGTGTCTGVDDNVAIPILGVDWS